MIKKLVLVRIKQSRSDLMDPWKSQLVGQPLNISPAGWNEEAGLTHYGFVLEGLKLAMVGELEKFAGQNNLTVLSLGTEKKPVELEEALASVGLRINTLA